MAGRPRSVDDEAILRAAVTVMGRTGPTTLTLAAVAQEAGVVPGTLIQRFGSKRGLLLALARRTGRDAGAAAGRVRAAHISPLAALAALITETWSALAEPEAFAHHLAFLCADLADAEFRQLALDAQRNQTSAIKALLDEAAQAGELRGGTDTGTLATVLQALAVGTGLIWATDREQSLSERQRAAIRAALAGHRTTPEGP